MLRRFFDLFRGNSQISSDVRPVAGELYESTATESQIRTEEALPGTSEIKLELKLVPPVLDSDILDREANFARNTDPNVDQLPDPVVECAVNYPASREFDCADLARRIRDEIFQDVLRPSFFVVTKSGLTREMRSEKRPERAIALIAAWSLSQLDTETVDDIVAASRRLSAWLTKRPEGFAEAELDRAIARRQAAKVREILAVRPESVGLTAFVGKHQPKMDGRRVWHILHAMGFKWGDMDSFQWPDPTHMVDYLVWAEVDDEELGYALPEKIAAGEQNFRAVTFYFDVARTPSPEHILEQMILAAETFATQLDCQLAASIDGKDAAGPDALRATVKDAVNAFAKLGLKPAMPQILRLR